MFQGALFTRDWLIEGITETERWQTLGDAEVDAQWDAAKALLGDLLARRNPIEAETETKLVWPLLALLGWTHVSVQQNMTVRGRKDVPDALLFLDDDADARARGLEPWQRFRHGAALVEAKRWNRALDREGQGEQGVPSTQLMHYLRRADDITGGEMRWGILTNGRQWRLYYQGAVSIAEDFFEIDLGKIFALPGCAGDLFDPPVKPAHAFRLFLLLFGRNAFVRSERGQSFHIQALEEGRRWEERVRRDLADTVFDRVFPRLIDALPRADEARPSEFDAAYAEEVRSAALFLLYRLLFVLYAEDRNLLPDEHGPYSAYCLTRLRQEIADARIAGHYPAARSHAYWSRLDTIFGAISEGDDDLGIPPYNGGLFDPGASALLSRVRLGDDVLADIILALSYREEEGVLRYINYRDLSVQQLGSIYESILEFGVEVDVAGAVVPKADNSARHRSGSYYTPESLVSLIIDRTVGPLTIEKSDAFAAAVAAGAAPEALAAVDPALAMLDLKIVDPAMGSGHFLVSLVDWLSDKVLTAIGEAEVVAGEGYNSPLVGRISELRDGIIANAEAHGWPIVVEQLDDRHIVRRMVLKRCVYGVDINPMAVELAKVALWLHSFTVGAPLSFLNHHLRCGNSVLGAWVRPTMLWLSNRGSLMPSGHMSELDAIAGQMEAIEALTDTDVTEVGQSKALFAAVAASSAPLSALMSMIKADDLMGVLDGSIRRPREPADQIALHGERRIAAMPAGGAAEQTAREAEVRRIAKAVERAMLADRRFDRAEALKMVHEGSFGDPARIAMRDIAIVSLELRRAFALEGALPVQDSLLPNVRPDDRRRITADAIVSEALDIADTWHFFHWEIAFPGVWSNLPSADRAGGFDAVIGNPPYVRQEEISPIKPALAKDFETYAGTADLYVYFYEQGLKLLRPGGRLGYVVTNKWLKAGYAAELRRLFSANAWIEFLADFGHARHLFPSADVSPCVITVRKPTGDAEPEEYDLAVIPRDDVPREGLAAAVAAATYRARRSELSEEAWVLEPPQVATLLNKIRDSGTPLSVYADASPLYGVKTGFNDAFLIDTATRDRLVAEDPTARDIIKPYLRGQDIDRWTPDWAGLWMIFARRGIDIEQYPSVLRYLETYREKLTPKPDDWRPQREGDEWPGRKAGTYAWYEVQDPVEYFQAFNGPKIFLRRIAFYAQFCSDEGQYYINDSALILPTADKWVLACLNSPVAWYFMFKKFPHKKDEALALDIPYVRDFPIPTAGSNDLAEVERLTERCETLTREIGESDRAMGEWLQIELDLTAVPPVLREASKLTSDEFLAATRAALPRRRALTPTQLRQLRSAYVDGAQAAAEQRAERLSCERAIAARVEAAYGLSERDIELLWKTAPPRMPLPPPPSLDFGDDEDAPAPAEA